MLINLKTRVRFFRTRVSLKGCFINLAGQGFTATTASGDHYIPSPVPAAPLRYGPGYTRHPTGG